MFSNKNISCLIALTLILSSSSVMAAQDWKQSVPNKTKGGQKGQQSLQISPPQYQSNFQQQQQNYPNPAPFTEQEPEQQPQNEQENNWDKNRPPEIN